MRLRKDHDISCQFRQIRVAELMCISESVHSNTQQRGLYFVPPLQSAMRALYKNMGFEKHLTQDDILKHHTWVSLLRQKFFREALYPHKEDYQ